MLTNDVTIRTDAGRDNSTTDAGAKAGTKKIDMDAAAGLLLNAVGGKYTANDVTVDGIVVHPATNSKPASWFYLKTPTQLRKAFGSCDSEQIVKSLMKTELVQPTKFWSWNTLGKLAESMGTGLCAGTAVGFLAACGFSLFAVITGAPAAAISGAFWLPLAGCIVLFAAAFTLWQGYAIAANATTGNYQSSIDNLENLKTLLRPQSDAENTDDQLPGTQTAPESDTGTPLTPEEESDMIMSADKLQASKLGYLTLPMVKGHEKFKNIRIG